MKMAGKTRTGTRQPPQCMQNISHTYTRLVKQKKTGPTRNAPDPGGHLALFRAQPLGPGPTADPQTSSHPEQKRETHNI